MLGPHVDEDKLRKEAFLGPTALFRSAVEMLDSYGSVASRVKKDHESHSRLPEHLMWGAFETEESVTRRVLEMITKRAAERAGETLVFVSHGGPTRHAFAAMVGRPPANLGGMTALSLLIKQELTDHRYELQAQLAETSRTAMEHKTSHEQQLEALRQHASEQGSEQAAAAELARQKAEIEPELGDLKATLCASEDAHEEKDNAIADSQRHRSAMEEQLQSLTEQLAEVERAKVSAATEAEQRHQELGEHRSELEQKVAEAERQIDEHKSELEEQLRTLTEQARATERERDAAASETAEHRGELERHRDAPQEELAEANKNSEERDEDCDEAWTPVLENDASHAEAFHEGILTFI